LLGHGRPSGAACPFVCTGCDSVFIGIKKMKFNDVRQSGSNYDDFEKKENNATAQSRK
jgi:hypothetical protein